MSDYILLIGTVLAGGLAALWMRKRPRWLPYLVSFSGAYLFAVIVFHLLPEIYGPCAAGEVSCRTAGFFLLAGLVFQLLLEYFSSGLEHGHTHDHDHILSAGALLGLFLHAFTEGLPVHQLHSHAYLHAILVHKFPIALTVATFAMQAWKDWRKTLAAVVLFALMSPLGAWAGEHVHFLQTHKVYVSAFVAGILTHISTVIIFESDRDHRLPLKKLAVILAAFVLAWWGAH
ncbi:MAG: ZIP family metal transporter [Chlorobi bacterium]|nr:ZIP family metal transporter [Chlorobiota bacterium]